MGGKISSQISKETLSLLGENLDFFETVKDRGLYAQTNLALKVTDSEARTETSVLPNGDVQVTLIYPLDDNQNPLDGRIYLLDRFVFDPNQEKAKGYSRDYFYNGSGRNKAQWRNWQAQYQEKEKGDNPNKNKWEKFAGLVARSYARPFTHKFSEIFSKPLSEETRGDLETPNAFLKGAEQAAGEYSLKRNTSSPLNHYSLVSRDLTTEITYSYVIEDNDEGTKGYLVLQDRFVIDKHSGALVGYDRAWKVAGKNAADEGWKEIAGQLNHSDKPTLEQAKVFINAFKAEIYDTKISDLVQQGVLDAAPASGAYQKLTPEQFQEHLNDLAFDGTALQLTDLDPGFFEALNHSANYFAALTETLGTELPFDVQNPQVSVKVEVEGKKTVVNIRYQIGEEVLHSRGYLQYNERWIFDGTKLEKIERSAKAVGEDPENKVAIAVQHINDLIQKNQLPQAGDPNVEALVNEAIPLVAPHLTVYSDKILLLDDSTTPAEQHPYLEALRDIQEALLPTLHAPDADPKFGISLLKAINALQYGDKEVAGEALQGLFGRENGALQASDSEAAVLKHHDNVTLIQVIGLIQSGETQKAKNLISSISSKKIREILNGPLDKILKHERLSEGLEIIAVVAQEQNSIRHHESLSWFHRGPEINLKEENVLLKQLIEKAQIKAQQSDAESPLDILQGLSDLSEKEKALVDRLSEDTLIVHLNQAAQEYNPEIQAHSYFDIAKNELFKNELRGSAQWLTQWVMQHKMPQSRANENVQVLGNVAADQLHQKYQQQVEASIEAMAKAQANDDQKQEKIQNKVMQALSSNEIYQEILKQKSAIPSLLEKADQAGLDPNQGALAYLQGVEGLTEDEEKVRKAWLNNPLFQIISAAAALPYEDRLKVYHKQFAQMVGGSQVDPVIKKQYASILTELESGGEQAPAAEGLLLISKITDLNNQMAAMTLQFSQLHEEMAKEVEPQLKAEFQSLQEALTSLLEIAQSEAISFPNDSGFTILQKLDENRLSELLGIKELDDKKDLSAEEKKTRETLIEKRTNLLKVREQLLQDKLLGQLSKIGDSTDFQERGKKYFDLTRGAEFAKSGLEKSAQWLQMMVIQKASTEKAADPSNSQAMERVEGKKEFEEQVLGFLSQTRDQGSLALKLDDAFQYFGRGVANPSTLAAMTVMGVVAPLGELAGFRLVGRFGATWGGRAVAAGIGGMSEGFAFTTTHKVLDSAFVSYEGQWGDYGLTYAKDVLASGITFNAIKAGHSAVAAFSQKVMATGARGFGWAGGYVAGEPAAAMSVTPFGRMLPAAARLEGNAVPQLTVWGERATAVMEHGAAMTAMHGVGRLNRSLHLQQDNGQGWQGYLFDDFVMYGQGIFGSQLAAGLNIGNLQAKAGEYRTMLDLAKPKIQPKSSKAKPENLVHLFRPESIYADYLGEKNLDGRLEINRGDFEQWIQTSAEQNPAFALRVALVKISPAEQLTLAKRLAKAKNQGDLLGALQTFPHTFNSSLVETLRQVFEEGASLQAIPTELGFRAQVSRILEGQVERMKAAGFDPNSVKFKADAINAEWTPVEAQFHLAQAYEAFKSNIMRVQDIAMLGQLLKLVPFESIEGTSVEEIESHLSDPEKLPASAGIRQRARDLAEMSRNLDPADNQYRNLKLEKDIIKLTKRFLSIYIPNDYATALQFLRQSIEQLTPQARHLLLKLKPEQRIDLLEAYFGPSKQRDISSAEQGMQIIHFLRQMGIARELGVTYVLQDGAMSPVLWYGNSEFPNSATYQMGRKRFISSDSVLFNADEIKELVDQARAYFLFKDKQGTPFYDPQTRTFKTWIFHALGESELQFKFGSDANVEDITQRFTLKKNGIDAKRQISGELDPSLSSKIKYRHVDEAEWKKGLPFELRSPTRWERAVSKMPAAPEIPEKWVQYLKKVEAEKKEKEAEKKRIAERRKAKGETPSPTAAASKTSVSTAAPAVKPIAPTTSPVEPAPIAEPAPAITEEPSAPVSAPISESLAPTLTSAEQGGGKIAARSLSAGLKAFLRLENFPRIEAAGKGIKKLLTRGPKPQAAVAKAGVPSVLPAVAAAPAAPRNMQFIFNAARSADPVLGPLPSLPQDYVLLAPKIVMGEAFGDHALAPEQLRFYRPADMLYGEVAGRTDEGKHYKDHNEDGISIAFVEPNVHTVDLVEGDLLLTDADGVGGYGRGKEANQLALQTIAERVAAGESVVDAFQKAHENIMSQFSGSGSAAVSALIRRPRAPGAPHTYDAFWAGDAKLYHLGRRSDGSLYWKYRTVDDGQAMALVDIAHQYGPGGVGRTLMGVVSPIANQVTQTLGITQRDTRNRRVDFKVHTTEDGEVPDPTNDKGVRKADGLRNVVLEEGDQLLLFSDFMENFGGSRFFLKIMEPYQSAEDQVNAVHAEAHRRMDVKKHADELRHQILLPIQEKFKIGKVASGEKVKFRHAGKNYYLEGKLNPFEISEWYFGVHSNATGLETTEGGLRVAVDNFARDLYGQFEDLKHLKDQDQLWVDTNGSVFEKVDSEKPIDHLKHDNLSLVIYVQHPKKVTPGDTLVESNEDEPTHPRMPSPALAAFVPAEIATPIDPAADRPTIPSTPPPRLQTLPPIPRPPPIPPPPLTRREGSGRPPQKLDTASVQPELPSPLPPPATRREGSSRPPQKPDTAEAKPAVADGEAQPIKTVSVSIPFKSTTLEEFATRYGTLISEDGIFITSSKPLPTGTPMRFNIKIAGNVSLLQGIGQVEWIRTPEEVSDNKPAGIYIKFKNFDSQNEQILRQILTKKAGEFSPSTVDEPSLQRVSPGNVLPQKAARGPFASGARVDQVAVQTRVIEKARAAALARAASHHDRDSPSAATTNEIPVELFLNIGDLAGDSKYAGQSITIKLNIQPDENQMALDQKTLLELYEFREQKKGDPLLVAVAEGLMSLDGISIMLP